MNKICELFGLNCKNDSLDFATAIKEQICPFTQTICSKMRKSNPHVKIGTCSVSHLSKDIVICPNRMLEGNKIFYDCVYLLDKHEQGNTLVLVPEVQIPGGHVDYFLLSVKNDEIIDFVGIELQAMDTSGTVWPERQRLLQEKNIYVDDSNIESPAPFGMNWKMTLKTTLLQIHHKCETFERFGKHLVLVVQNHLLDHMKSDFNFELVNRQTKGDSVHIHSYSFDEVNGKFSFSLESKCSTDSNGIAACLGLNKNHQISYKDLENTLINKMKSSKKRSL